MNIAFPVFLLAKDSGGVRRYATFEQLEGDLEKIDIENSEYEAWDKNGVRLKLKVEEPTWLRIEERPGVRDVEDLAKAIENFAHRKGVHADSEKLSMGDFEGALNEVNECIYQKWASQSFLKRLFSRP